MPQGAHESVERAYAAQSQRLEQIRAYQRHGDSDAELEEEGETVRETLAILARQLTRPRTA